MPTSVIELLNDPKHGLTVLGDDTDPLILAGPLATKLGYPHTSRLLALVKDDEKGTTEIRTPAGMRTASYVTLSGLFRAMGSRPVSRIPDDEMRRTVEWFQDWIYREVVPSIARTGQYLTPEAQELYGERAKTFALLIKPLRLLAPRIYRDLCDSVLYGWMERLADARSLRRIREIAPPNE